MVLVKDVWPLALFAGRLHTGFFSYFSTKNRYNKSCKLPHPSRIVQHSVSKVGVSPHARSKITGGVTVICVSLRIAFPRTQGSVFPHTHITNNLPNHKSQWYMFLWVARVFPQAQTFPALNEFLPRVSLQIACMLHAFSITLLPLNIVTICIHLAVVGFGSFNWNPF